MSPHQSIDVFVPEQPFSAQLEEDIQRLTELREGWLDGEGLVPLPGAFQSIRRILAITTALNLPDPGLTPAPDGGIDLTWITRDVRGNIDRHDAAILSQDGQSVYVYDGRHQQTHALEDLPTQPDAVLTALFQLLT
jgi:hypothetical protein